MKNNLANPSKKHKFKLIIIIIILFILAKTHSIIDSRINIVPEKVYEINTLPNICENVKAGGFSDLFYKDGKLYILTDRGPNSDIKYISDKEVRIFYCPGFVPLIYEVNLKENEGIKVSGKGKIKGISSLPIEENSDCLPISSKGTLLQTQLSGADTESFIIDKKGNYWVGEEYYPSIIKLNKDMEIEKRFAPKNSNMQNSKIIYNLPEELNSIQRNYGFQAMAYDGKNHIYVFTQSTLSNDMYGRVVRFNIRTEKPDKVYKYEIDSDSTISGAVMYNKNTILTVENRNGINQVRQLNLKGKILKSKKLYPLIGLNKIDGHTKIEGIAYGGKKLYIVNDNDFGMNEDNRNDNFILEFTLK
ncbi:esterase-like activity of phytase family protein [bacterium]|nr:esterase-like activity of phytase family protein [bacterium]